MVLGPQGPGRVGRRQAIQEPLLVLINGDSFLLLFHEIGNCFEL